MRLRELLMAVEEAVREAEEAAVELAELRREVEAQLRATQPIVGKTLNPEYLQLLDSLQEVEDCLKSIIHSSLAPLLSKLKRSGLRRVARRMLLRAWRLADSIDVREYGVHGYSVILKYALVRGRVVAVELRAAGRAYAMLSPCIARISPERLRRYG
ncbi:MAG: hypothetical protein DRK00_06535 [Thermoprotei archaeon]|nr:MAG: hypothetical protein DRK00_06535 [Thermoprotei archaeon]